MKIRILEAAAFIALGLCILLSVSFEGDCRDIRSSVFRLHIPAASDSAEDQRLKLKVRDAVMSLCGELFSDCSNASQAQQTATENIGLFRKTALSVIEAEGSSTTVSVEVTQGLFPTKSYDGLTLPAGCYSCLRITLGSGEGKNWWCVMYPFLCLPAATGETAVDFYFDEKSTDIICNSEKYEIRLWIVEKYYEIKELFI